MGLFVQQYSLLHCIEQCSEYDVKHEVKGKDLNESGKEMFKHVYSDYSLKLYTWMDYFFKIKDYIVILKSLIKTWWLFNPIITRWSNKNHWALNWKLTSVCLYNTGMEKATDVLIKLVTYCTNGAECIFVLTPINSMNPSF